MNLYVLGGVKGNHGFGRSTQNADSKERLFFG